MKYLHSDPRRIEINAIICLLFQIRSCLIREIMPSPVDPDFHWSTLAIGLLAPVVAIIILLGMIGNILVIIVLWQQQRRSHRATGSYFLINLAIADIFGSANLIFMLSTIINHGEWIFGKYICKLNGVLTVLLGATSLLTLCAISVNRYFKIVEGGKYNRIYTNTNTLRMLAVTWLVPFVLALAPILGWSEHEYQVGKCVCHFLFSRSISYTVTFAVFVVIAPFTVILFCYLKIYKIIKTHGAIMGNLRRSQPSVHVEDIKIATTLFIVILVFIVCYIPASIVNIVQMINPDFHIPHWLDMVSFLLVVSNHANNPIIYNALNRSFRQAFREVLRLRPRREPRDLSGSGAKYPNCQSRTGTTARSPSNPGYQNSSTSSEKHSPEIKHSFDFVDKKASLPCSKLRTSSC